MYLSKRSRELLESSSDAEEGTATQARRWYMSSRRLQRDEEEVCASVYEGLELEA